MNCVRKIEMRIKKNRNRAMVAASCAVLSVLLTGCLPGPKYHAPAAPASPATRSQGCRPKMGGALRTASMIRAISRCHAMPSPLFARH